MLPLLSLIAIFMLIMLHSLWTACLHSFHSLPVHSFLFKILLRLSNFLLQVNQYRHSFIPFTSKLWNSLPSSILIIPTSYDKPLNQSASLFWNPFCLLLWEQCAACFPFIVLRPQLASFVTNKESQLSRMLRRKTIENWLSERPFRRGHG